MIDYWRHLQPRERGLIGVAALVAAAVVVWAVIWEPLQDSRAALVERIAAQRALLDWLDRVEPEVDRLRASSETPLSLEGDSMLSVIDKGARAAGLAGALKRIEPGTGGEVRVVFEQAAFPGLMRWLGATVAERPLAVARITADRAGPGRVDSVVVLRRTDVGND